VDWNGSQATFFADNDGPFTLGFSFRVDSALRVTSLGAFDYLGNGLIMAHQVGIWPIDGGTPLAVATVPSGSSAPLLGAFRYIAIPDLKLSANTVYVIGASDYYGQALDIYPYLPQDFSTAMGVTYLDAHETADGTMGLVFPQFDDVPGSPLAANFQFEIVPEPSDGLLLCTGVGCLLAFRMRSQREGRRTDRMQQIPRSRRRSIRSTVTRGR
jgi:hypothetical protein